MTFIKVRLSCTPAAGAEGRSQRHKAPRTGGALRGGKSFVEYANRTSGKSLGFPVAAAHKGAPPVPLLPLPGAPGPSLFTIAAGNAPLWSGPVPSPPC